MYEKATKVLVIVVPIFAPITIGTACCKLILPEATTATIMAVFEQERVVGAEEIMLWTRSRMEGRKMIDLMREQKARPDTEG